MCMPPYSKQIPRNWMVEHILTVIKNVFSFSGQERFYFKSHFQADNIHGNLGIIFIQNFT